MIDQRAVKEAFELVRDLERLDEALRVMDGPSGSVAATICPSVKTFDLKSMIDLKETLRKGMFEKRAEIILLLNALGVKA